jgi:hypothetical protein
MEIQLISHMRLVDGLYSSRLIASCADMYGSSQASNHFGDRAYLARSVACTTQGENPSLESAKRVEFKHQQDVPINFEPV